jgi:hypothetical protein
MGWSRESQYCIPNRTLPRQAPRLPSSRQSCTGSRKDPRYSHRILEEPKLQLLSRRCSMYPMPARPRSCRWCSLHTLLLRPHRCLPCLLGTPCRLNYRRACQVRIPACSKMQFNQVDQIQNNSKQASRWPARTSARGHKIRKADNTASISATPTPTSPAISNAPHSPG